MSGSSLAKARTASSSWLSRFAGTKFGLALQRLAKCRSTVKKSPERSSGNDSGPTRERLERENAELRKRRDELYQQVNDQAREWRQESDQHRSEIANLKEALAEWKADAATHFERELEATAALEAALAGNLAASKAETVADRLAFVILVGLMRRHEEPGYSDKSAISEAYRLAAVGLECRARWLPSIAVAVNRDSQPSRVDSNETTERKEVPIET